jgi:hypothetical protein
VPYISANTLANYEKMAVDYAALKADMLSVKQTLGICQRDLALERVRSAELQTENDELRAIVAELDGTVGEQLARNPDRKTITLDVVVAVALTTALRTARVV